MSDEPKATRGRKRRSPRPPGSNRTDAEMEESEERYRILVGALQEGVLLQMADGSIAVCNPSAARILGLPSDQMIRGRASFDTLSPAIREDGSPLPRDDHPAITALRTGKPVTGAIMGVQRANGESVWISVSAQPLFHRGEAHPYGVVTSFFDVTERKRIEQALRVSEDLYRDLVEHAKALICIHDLEGRLLAVNEAAEKNLGYDRHMHLGREIVTIRDLMAPETRPGFERYLETIRTAGAADGVMAVQTRKGEKRYWEYHNSLRSEGVETPVVRGVAFDVTERLKAQQALRESEERFRKLVENSSDVFVLLSREGRIDYASASLTRVLGYAVEEYVGRLPSEFTHPEEVERMRNLFASLLEKPDQVIINEARMWHKDGTWRLIESTSTNHLSEPAIEAVVVNFRDITERRQLEVRVREMQKMEAIGQLAAGIAHDFNNLLTVILGDSELVLSELGDSHPQRSQLEEIRQAGRRAAGLTRRLLEFSRKQVLAPEVLDLRSLVAGLESTLHRLVPDGVRVVSVTSPGLGRVRADSGQIEQIVLNLASNGGEAMPEGGVLTIETSNFELDEAYAREHPPARPGSYVRLSVSDSGVGMDEKTKSRVFEPFFTTKPLGKGAGLGLATVYGIVKQARGYITVESESGRGTTFEVYLPRFIEPIEKPPRATLAQATKERIGAQTVLLVEDEDLVRRLAKKILERESYTVLEAPGGLEALEIASKHAGPIDLLLTDVMMPGLNGTEIAPRIAASRPGIKVLYMSGYTDNLLETRVHLEAGAAFLPKPFAPDKLTRAVREVLGN